MIIVIILWMVICCKNKGTGQQNIVNLFHFLLYVDPALKKEIFQRYVYIHL